MTSISKISIKTSPPFETFSWQTPSFRVTLIASPILKATVYSVETDMTTYDVDVKAPFSTVQLNQLQKTIQDHFYMKVIQSNNVPVRVEFLTKGLGGGFYSQSSTSLPSIPQGKASLTLMPKTPQELVWVLQQLKVDPNNNRVATLLSAANEFINVFANNPTHSKEQIDGLVLLVLIDDKVITRTIINQLIDLIRNNTLLNLDLVLALADAIDRASPSFLNPDDLVQLMLALVERIKKTHATGAEKNFEEQLKALVRILNAMVDANVCDIPRQKHEEIGQFLSNCSKSNDCGINSIAVYANQALSRIPNDESKLAAFLRYSTGLIKGVYHFYAALNKLDPGQLVKGFFALQESVGAIVDFAKLIGTQMQNVLPELQAALGQDITLKTRTLKWYDQIRYVEFLIASNCFRALEQFLMDPRLKKESFFMYSLSIKLHEVILTHPNAVIRNETLQLLHNLYQDEKTWSGLTLKEDHFKNEKAGMLEFSKKEDIRYRLYIKGLIVSNLQFYVNIPVLRTEALNALGSLVKQASAAEKLFIEKYRNVDNNIPISISPTSIKLFEANPKEQFKLEDVLENIKACAVNDPEFQKDQQTYIPLMGTSAHGASATCELLEEVQLFLKGDQRVLLLMGDSGSGKSLFCQTLAYHLWQTYQPITGIIPFYISLPTLKDPVHKLISQAAKQLGLSPEQMEEIKTKREIVFILDGGDEIPKNSDILAGNQLTNFKGKIIVTYRIEALPSSDLFIPNINGKPKRSLLRELYIAPFSPSQIDQFIQKCISLGNTEWDQVAIYREQMERITGLQDLIQNPFILKIMTDTLPEIIDRAKQVKAEPINLTRYTLYEAFMEEWFQNGFNRVKMQFPKLQSVGLKPQNLKKEAANFCIQLANTFQSQKETHIQYDTEDPIWTSFFSDDLRAETLRSMAPLKISEDGTCYFLHKSLLEYFIALGTKTLVTLPKNSKTSNTHPPTLKPNESLIKRPPIFDSILEPSIWRFLADTVKEDSAFREELFSFIEQSKVNPLMATAAANAITILNLANVSFSKKDFRGIRVPHANLEKAIFYRTDLCLADLSHVNLSGAFLSEALLDQTLMERVDFGQLPMIIGNRSISVVISSFDGKQLIGSSNNSIIIWDWRTGHEIMTLEGHTAHVMSLAYLPEEELLASGSYDNTIRLWNLKTGESLKVLLGHTKPIETLMFLPEKELLASGSKDGTIILWDFKTGEAVKTLKEGTAHVMSLAYLPEEELLASGSINKTIRLWNLKTGKTIKILYGHTGPVTALVFLPGGEFLASGSWDCTIRLWNLKTGTTVKTLQGHTSWVTSLLPLPGGEFLASSGKDNTIRLWNLKTGETMKTFQGHTSCVNSLTLLEEGKILASAGDNDKTIRLWDLKAKESLKNIQGHTTWVSALTLLQDGEYLASGSHDKTIHLMNLKTGEIVKTFHGHTKRIDALIFLSGGELLASGSEDNTIRIWDRKTGKAVKTLYGHTRVVSSLILLPGGEHMASGSADKTIRIWDLKTGMTIKTFQAHSVQCLAYLPGELLASTSRSTESDDYTIILWDLKTGEAVKTLQGHRSPVLALASLPGERLASGSFEMSIRIWDLKTGQTIQTLQGHTAYITALTLLSGGELLASGSDDKTIRFWNLKTGQEVFKITHPFSIQSLVFKEPNLLYAGDSVGGVWCWQLNHDGKTFHPQLLWATNPSFICQDVQIGKAHGLSPGNQRLMLQYGAKE